MKDLEQTIGQYIVYRELLDKTEPERLLYVAVSTKIFRSVFEEGLGELFLARQILRLMVFDPKQEVITQWIPE